MTPPEIDQALYEHISAAARVELTDALNTEKYTKQESHARIEAVKAKVAESVAAGEPVTDPAGRGEAQENRFLL